MAKEETLEFEGAVTDVLPDGRFRVQLDNGHEIIAYTAGRMKRNRIKTIAGDRVTVEMTPYDLEKGRVISGTRPTPAHVQAAAGRVLSAAAAGRAKGKRQFRALVLTIGLKQRNLSIVFCKRIVGLLWKPMAIPDFSNELSCNIMPPTTFALCN
ncbi:MAG: translation initiation factor IF-1 [Rhodomicrobium sp.]|nr:translation initiation factor IF-1 [Rhodomicrobium sp.]